MLKSTRESATSRTLAMASSKGIHFASYILFLQVVMLTGHASAQDFSRTFYPGRQVYGSYPADQYPRPQYPGPLFPGPQFPRHQFPGPQYPGPPGPQYPGPPGPQYPGPPGPQYPGPPLPPTPPPPEPRGPPYSDEDLVCLIGSDLEVPFPLYKQISESFLSSTNILVLCPNNTIVQVQGYAGLKELTQEDPDNTKVLISSESMVPAPIYLRVVLIQPEEIMIRLPDGVILPHQIYLEQYGKEPETHEHGGQTFFEAVPPEDSFPFLVENDKKSDYGKPFPPSVPIFPSPLFTPAEGDPPTLVPVPYDSWQYSAPNPRPQYPDPRSVSRHPEPVTSHHRRPNPMPQQPELMAVPHHPRPSPVHHHPELVSVPHHPRPQPAPQHAEPYYGQPRRLDRGPAPYNFDQRPVQHHPRSAPFPLHPDHHQPTSTPYNPMPPPPVQVAEPIETQRPASEQKTFLPAGVHVIETSRCSICDPDSDDGAHVTVFSV